MTLPTDLILVRHGESEGNVATKFSRQGDNRYFTTALLARHSSRFRLSPEGREQAKATGKWIREELGKNDFMCGKEFDRYLTSEYARAMETALLLGLPNANWYINSYLRERGWGDMEVLPEDARRRRFGDSMRVKIEEPFHWRPPNGESIAELCLRVDRVLDTLHRESEKRRRVIIVCHGEVMWAFRARLERLTHDQYKKLDLSKNPHDRIHNGQVLHYTRCDPAGTGLTYHYMEWMRSVCPWDMSLSRNEWERIERPKFTNEELLALVEENASLIE